ncbi:probable aminopeptidase NPEPL1 [Lytechinus pictus]|uniref:probable aminopeptidase NPEPL1 n=1 Tax=Lytechinus pictus TaxID=7653 RepID=UPI0030B9E834
MASVKSEMLQFSATNTTSDPADRSVLIVGQLPNLTKVPYDTAKTKLQPRVNEESYRMALGCLSPSPTDTVSLWFNNATLAALPVKASRHNTPSRSHILTKLVRSCLTGSGNECIVVACEHAHVFALGCAIARAFPLYSRKAGSHKQVQRVITVEFVITDEDNSSLTDEEVGTLNFTAQSIRESARIVDMPCSEMNTMHFVQEVQRVGQGLGITPLVIQGEELQRKGFGGIYGVGKAAANPPAFAVLSHTPPNATQTIAWVGKGIVYDTGGLSIKGKTAMPGMKRDCGGAAAILGAFEAAVKAGFEENLHALFCLAENAVGPDATRPDDVHIMYSGRSVEINNTDAEGRLVLADGVSYAARDLKADIIVDMATLTGAQGISTGKYHAGLLTNNEDWEMASMKAGRNTGDLVFPLVYSPELHFSEFGSAVADMKNSVADRGNAQSSCAGLFIGSHIGFDFGGVWIHFDIASPSYSGERATGFGVGLLLGLFGRATQSKLLQSISPCGLNQDDEMMVESATKKIRLI